MLRDARDRVAMENIAKSLINKVQSNFDVSAIPTPDMLCKKHARLAAEKKPGRKSIKKGTHSRWTLEEDKIVCDKQHLPTRVVARDYILSGRHTKNAVSTRLCIVRTGALERMGKTRAKEVSDYLRSEAGIFASKSVIKKSWTAKEDKIIRNNPGLSTNDLVKMLPGRSSSEVWTRDRDLNSKSRKKTPWSSKELLAIELNLDMKPKQLAKLSKLKDKSVGQISQKKYAIRAALSGKED